MQRTLLIVTTVMIGGILLLWLRVNRVSQLPTPTPELSPIASAAPSLMPETSLIIKASPLPSPIASMVPSPSATPIASAQPSPSLQPSPTPRAANPPHMNISYPAEMQAITMNSSQTFCVVDTPNGGDQSGLQRKQNSNDSGWTDYATISTLCFSPNEGTNKIQLQYRNSYGEESEQYTRQFTFHRE